MVRLWELFLDDRPNDFSQVLAHERGGLDGRLSQGRKASGKDAKREANRREISRDANARDFLGRTLLHLIASSASPKASTFAEALLQLPLDLRVQDLESGWTPLHRALYHGNIRTAQAILAKGAHDLIKIKDREGNSPFEVYNLTIGPRDLRFSTSVPTLDPRDSDDENGGSPHSAPGVGLLGDQVVVFGSNKNLNLGLGDEDDRNHPENIVLERPPQLLQRLALENGPTAARYSRIVVQDVIMSKLHTAVITTDPEANVYMCGYGSGGRLGTGDEVTRFTYVCLGLPRVVAMALGQDHTIAVCEQGVFTWGSNRFGQLGYDTVAQKSKDAKQLSPRQLFGSIKRENIIGAAASSLHSVLITSLAAYTFGKNEGQLGLMDADARSLKLQTTPRRVGTSIIQSSIQMVSAIDRATAFLLENHEVLVFTHYGWTKVAFPAPSFKNIREGYISKITGAGNTLCALSSLGEIYTVDIGQMPVPPSKQSTTNPSKARNALPPPVKVWHLGKTHMAAKEVAVGHDGSISLCTVSGSVWRREKRVKAKTHKNHKFIRIPIHNAVGVRSNAFGSHAAICKDVDVMREQLCVDPPSLWDTFFSLLPLQRLLPRTDEHSRLRFWTPRPSVGPVDIKKIILEPDLAARIQASVSKTSEDLWVASSEIRLPVHSFLFKARSRVLRKALDGLPTSYYFSNDVLSLEYGADGVCLKLDADILTVTNLVLYLYTDTITDVWHGQNPQLATRHRQIRAELMRIAAALEMEHLERAARVMTEPERCLQADMESALPGLFSNADVLIELSDGELPAHRAILRRSPFFEGLFGGHSQGQWSRRAEHDDQIVRVDLKHVDTSIFLLVRRHLYADTGEELFDSVDCADLDGLIDTIIDVLAVANELMLDRLAQICQKVLGRYVTTRNVCHILNAVAPCAVDQFKCAALEYICLNLEIMLEFGLLDELDNDLLPDLEETVRANQKAWLPGRVGEPDQDMLDRYPDLPGKMKQGRHRLADSIRLRSHWQPDATDQAPSGEQSANDPEMFEMDMAPTDRSYDDAPAPAENDEYPEGQHEPETEGRFSQDPIGSQSPLASIQSRSTPWQSPTTFKTSFKDIMADTHTSRDLPSAVKRDLHVAKTRSKISQKERKKMQQLASLPVPAPSPQIATSPRSSPWKTVSHEKLIFTSSIPPSQPRPPMTIRQTLSGAPPKPKQPTPSSPTPQIPIRSIRHTTPPPLPASNPTTHSMSYILLEQRTQQSALQEASVPHSMDDIQQEQEFQSWWDSESRRVQQEELDREQKGREVAEGARGRRGRGRGRGKGRGGGDEAGAAGTVTAGERKPLARREGSKAEDRPKRGRGRGRGQGQGRDLAPSEPKERQGDH